MELSPQARRWARSIAKGGVVALGIYAAVQIAFAVFIIAAFGLGGEIG